MTLQKAAARALAAYRKYIETDELDQLQVAMTDLQEALEQEGSTRTHNR